MVLNFIKSYTENYSIFHAAFFFILSRLFPLSRVGRGTLMLRHSVSLFPLNFQDIVCWVAELHSAFCLSKRIYESNLNTIISSIGDRTHNFHLNNQNYQVMDNRLILLKVKYVPILLYYVNFSRHQAARGYSESIGLNFV